MALKFGFWAGRNYNLARMNMRGLVKAYFSHYAVAAYFALAAASLVAALSWATAWLPLLAAGAVAVVLYPVIWYGLHRWVLHGAFLYKRKVSSSVWKRIHFDHHQDPHDLGVLFGALYTTLPTLAAFAIPIGWLIGGPAGAAMALCTGLLTTCFYEFCHSAQHLNYVPRSKAMQKMKRWHLLHHFHNENGNHGITNFLVDRLFGTFYAKAKDVPKSATVFNLGYDEAQAELYPWVAELSGTIRVGSTGRRWRPHTPAAGAEAVGADLYGDRSAA